MTSIGKQVQTADFEITGSKQSAKFTQSAKFSQSAKSTQSAKFL
jgi:hypothetical protein